eukprot:TRINITY_DN6499_c0_g2_i2.p1 TRINITY_DN6499_c0_g2~~TRINITY_DN6499_c0_g2_i2.p1  ORF type:complete len:437 (-),score=90.95 TRINITY_DN6499_c0_g2_i2:27-1337(-)
MFVVIRSALAAVPRAFLLRNKQVTVRWYAKASRTQLETPKVSERRIFIETDYILKPISRMIYTRLERGSKDFQEVNKDFMSADGNEKVDLESLERNRIRMLELEPLNTLFQKMHSTIMTLNDLVKMSREADKTDKETIEFAEEEIKNTEKQLDQIEDEAVELLIPKERYDSCDSITVEIRPGVGGTESALFADDVLKMYQNYFAMHGWNCRVTQYTEDYQIGKGCKFGALKVHGHEVYKRMKCESGVHKVIRVPETEGKGRLHSSTISVVVLPEMPMDFKLNEKDLKIEFMKASGPGGQHVNKTESACRITHVPTGISVHMQDDRSQDANKRRAMNIIKDKLFTMEVLKNQEKINSHRRDQVDSSDRSEKIRTYNFPQSRITDHRTGLTLFGIEKMLRADFLDQFIDEYLDKIYNMKLNELMIAEGMLQFLSLIHI